MPAPDPKPSPGDARVPIGNPELDQILSGGLLARRPYLIVGPAGTGKTTLALQFLCEGIRRGENCLIVTLEEPPNEMRANHPALAPELDRVFVFDAIPDVMRYERTPFKDIAAVRQSVAFGQVSLDIRRTPELSSVEVTFTALEQTLKMEAARRPYSRLVIDSLTALQYFCMKGVDETVGAQTFLRFLSDLRITTLLTVEAPLEDVETPERLLARGEVRLFRWELDGITVRAVGVEKFRGSEHDIRLHPYRITPHGLAINLGVTISRDTRQIIEQGPPPRALEPVEALAELDAATAFAEFLRRDLDGVLAAHGDLGPIRSAVHEAARAVGAGDPVTAWAALRAARRLADQQLRSTVRPEAPIAQLDAGPPPLARIRELVAQVSDLIGPIPAAAAPPPVAPVPVAAAAPSSAPLAAPSTPASVPLEVRPKPAGIPPEMPNREEPPAPPPAWPGGASPAERPPTIPEPTPPVVPAPPPPAPPPSVPGPVVSSASPPRAVPPRTPLGRTASRLAHVFSRGNAGRPSEPVPAPAPSALAHGSPQTIHDPPRPPAEVQPVDVHEAPPLPRPREELPKFEPAAAPIEAAGTPAITAVVEPAPMSDVAPPPSPEASPSVASPEAAETPTPSPPFPVDAEPVAPPEPTASPQPMNAIEPIVAPAAPVSESPAPSVPAEPTPPAPKRRRRAPGTGTPRRKLPPAPTPPIGGEPAVAAPAETIAPAAVTELPAIPGASTAAGPPPKPKRRAPRKRKAPTVVSAAAGTGPPGNEPTAEAAPPSTDSAPATGPDSADPAPPAEPPPPADPSPPESG